jgi:hypothetical protein
MESPSKAVNIPCHPERSELASVVKDLTANAGIVWEILRKLRMTGGLRMTGVGAFEWLPFLTTCMKLPPKSIFSALSPLSLEGKAGVEGASLVCGA